MACSRRAISFSLCKACLRRRFARAADAQRWMAPEIACGYTPEDVRMNYKVVLNESDEVFSVSCPGLPGCWSQGASEEEALENIQDAISEYLAAVDELVQGQQVLEVSVVS